MKTENGDAPSIDDIRIDFAVAIRVGNHFAASREADVTAVDFARALLKLHTVTFFLLVHAAKHADSGHIAAAAKFDVIAAGKIILAIKLPPGHVQVHAAGAVVIVRGSFLELREIAIATAAD